MAIMIAFVILLFMLFGLGSMTITKYNKLVMLDSNADKAFANIDVLLKQRADEVPELIRVVKQGRSYEEEILTRLTKLRSQYLEAKGQDQRIQAANALQKGLSSLFAVAENHPELKASAQFERLQGRISQLEDKIADRREFFNESVNHYNIGIREFPELILARILGYKPRALLDVSEEETRYAGAAF